MGVSKLEDLARCGVSGAVAALLSELVVAEWQAEAELVAQFPLASFANGVVRIPVADSHVVELIIKYDVGIVLVARVGATAQGSKADKSRSWAA